MTTTTNGSLGQPTLVALEAEELWDYGQRGPAQRAPRDPVLGSALPGVRPPGLQPAQHSDGTGRALPSQQEPEVIHTITGACVAGGPR